MTAEQAGWVPAQTVLAGELPELAREEWCVPLAQMPDGEGVTVHASTCTLGPECDSVRAARMFTADTLRGWGMAELCDAMELVVSELVTNALRHGLSPASSHPQRPVQLKLLRKMRHVLCVVTDPSIDVPVRKEPDFVAETGRGLQVVASCSHHWGWVPLAEGGKAVWALLSCSS